MMVLFATTSLLLLGILQATTAATGTRSDDVCDQQLCDCHQTDNSLSVLCSRKSLSTIPQNIPVNATNLDLSLNQIRLLQTCDFPVLPLLRSVNLQQSTVERLEKDVFCNLPALEEIQLNHNDISVVSSSSFRCLGRSMHRLSLDHNMLSSLPGFLLDGLRLESLSLQDNARLTFLSRDVFRNVSVEVLSLDRCNLSRITGETLSPLLLSLRSLMWSYSLQSIWIDERTFAGFNLTMLNLIQDGLTSLDFLKANFSVQNLDISHNDLGNVDLSDYIGLHRTETLLMNDCNITTLSVNTSLSSHSPSTNPSSLDFSLHHLSQIHQLDLSRNKLRFLEPQLFRHLYRLRRLTLTSNPLLVTFSPDLKPSFSRLETLDIYGMTLSCDCRIDWFRRWIQSSPEVSITGAHCTDGQTDLAHVGPLLCTAPKIVGLTQRVVEDGEVVEGGRMLEGDVGIGYREPVTDYDYDYNLSVAFSTSTSSSTSSELKSPASIRLTCTAESIPAPDVHWQYTDGEPLDTELQTCYHHHLDRNDHTALSPTSSASLSSPSSLFSPTSSSTSSSSSSNVNNATTCIAILGRVTNCVSVQCVARNTLSTDYRTVHVCVNSQSPTTPISAFHIPSSVSDHVQTIGWVVGAGLLTIVLVAAAIVLFKRRSSQCLPQKRRVPRATTSSTCLVTTETEDMADVTVAFV